MLTLLTNIRASRVLQLSPQHLSWGHLSISAISQLLLAAFNQTFNNGSWEHIQQITTVTTTFVQATFVLGTFAHISNISAVTGPIWIKL